MILRLFITHLIYFAILINGSCITSNLPTSRYSLTATSVGNLVMFAGGFDYETQNSYSTVEILNTSSNTWSSHNLATGGGYMTSVSVNDLAFFNAGAFSGVLDVYNSTSNIWSTTALSINRYYEGVASVGNYVLWGGGWTTHPVANVDIFVYNSSKSGIDAGNWKTASLSEPRQMLLAVAVANNYVLFAGGINTSLANSATIDIFNLATQSWSVEKLPHPNYDNGFFYAVAVSTRAIFINYGFSKATVDILDTATWKWSNSTISTYRFVLIFLHIHMCKILPSCRLLSKLCIFCWRMGFCNTENHWLCRCYRRQY